MQSSITNEVSIARHLHHVVRYMGSEINVHYHLANSAPSELFHPCCCHVDCPEFVSLIVSCCFSDVKKQI